MTTQAVLRALASEGESKDLLLQALLAVLRERGMARKWAESAKPYSDLDQECTAAASDALFARQMAAYLGANPVIGLSVRTFLAHLCVAANARPEQVPGPQQLLIPVGARIARWMPTFLAVEGPLGRLLRRPHSPLNKLLREEYRTYPTLTQARDTFNHDLYRDVRNGIGHWAFGWEQDASGERLVCFDSDSGKRTAEVSTLEAEALHVVSFSVIECIDRRLLPLQLISAEDMNSRED